MDSVSPITHHAELISRLGATLPIELDRLALAQAMGLDGATSQIAFRFAYCDVPFAARVERRGGGAALHLAGDLGPLPFTVQAPLRRRRALRTMAAASRATGLDWYLTEAHGIAVTGEIELARPVTPSQMVAGAIAVLLRGERYLALLLDVLGEADYLNSAEAA